MFSTVREALANPVAIPAMLLVLLVLAIYWTISGVASDKRPKEPRFSENKPLNALGWFGLLSLPFGAIIFLAVLWELLALAWSYPNLESAKENASDIRWHGSIMLAMLAALGALFTLLFAYIRVFTTERQTKAAERQASATEEALFNDKINAATEDLHAQRQVTLTETGEDGRTIRQDVWEDDIIKRNAAIDRLEGLAKERPDAAPRIARMLSVFTRELSARYPPEASPDPDEVSARDLHEWVNSLTVARSDMEKAVQTLGRLHSHMDTKDSKDAIDLRRANLQGFDLRELNFEKARLSKAQMQGADLSKAQMQGAELSGAQLQGANLRGAQLQGAKLLGAQMQVANLREAQLQGAYLSRAQLQEAFLGGAQMQGAYLDKAQMQGAYLGETQLQGANLSEAQMQGAELSGAQMQRAVLSKALLQGADLSEAKLDRTTILSTASLRGAALRVVDCSDVDISQDQIVSIFGDQTVILPESLNRPDWPDIAEDDWIEFHVQWREWQKSIGFDPDDPATW